MEGLAPVNLLVGKNNSGKSAVLEGIQLLASGGDPAVLSDVAERRGEIIVAEAGSPYDATIDVAHFFCGHSISPGSAFSIAGDGGESSVKVKVANGKRESRARAERRRGARDYHLEIESRSPERNEFRQFQISRDGVVDFDGLRGLRRSGFRRPPFAGPPLSSIPFMGPESLSAVDMAPLWNELILQGKEVDVLKAMQILERDLTSIHFLTGVSKIGYIPAQVGIVVGIKGQTARLPLGSMGDGMRRIMALALALALAQDRALLVDEIDTGLHCSVMPEMWKLVISEAQSSGIQVFATTHSWDCIEALGQVCEEDPAFARAVAVHKLDREIPHSITFTGESLVRMAKADIDPR